jgi:copper(I)-binding protein
MKFHHIAGAATAAAFALCASVQAAEYKSGNIHIDNAWARATAPGQVNGGAYLQIRNEGKAPDRLVSVKSDAADRVEVHMTKTQGGVSSMGEVSSVDVPAGGKVVFSPGGYHIMFLKLKGPFTAGAEVPATLNFEEAGAVAVKFDVKPVTYNPGGADGMHMGAH